MKKILFYIIIAFTISSCVTLPAPKSSVGIIDYTPLIKEGIFVTESNSVNFDYTAIGSIIATEKGGWTNGSVKRPTADAALKNIIKELNRLGANGIINLMVTSSVEMSEDMMTKVFIPVVTIKGMAIKIPNSNLKKIPTIKEDQNIMGEIEGVKCRIIEKYKNGMRISTSKELTIDQIKKAKREFALNGKVMFNVEGRNEKGQSYAGVDDEYIILYKTNEFIPLSPQK